MLQHLSAVLKNKFKLIFTTKRDSGVEIWDSSDPLGMERGRGWYILNRNSDLLRCETDPVHQSTNF